MSNHPSLAFAGPAPDAHGESRPSQVLRLCVMATIGKSIQVLYAGRLEYLVSQGFDITVVCASSEMDDAIRGRGVRLVTMPLTRAITPLSDLRAAVSLYRFFRKERFDLVEVSTPKAALVGSIAAWLARSRCVVHLLQGLAYEGKSGLQGAVLRTSTWIPCRLADITVAVSNSLREQVIVDGIGDADSTKVLGPGTVNGLDLKRFALEKCADREVIRKEYRIPSDGLVLGFVGRMTRDKGIDELTKAFEAVHREFSHTVLLIVGDYEERDRPSAESIAFISSYPAVRHVGWQNDVVPFMAAMDVFVLPTHREGLGVVLLEAAALGIPSVTTHATGARDAVLDGVTGLRVPLGDVVALTAAMKRLVQDTGLRETLGRAGREWVCKNFNQKEVWQRQVDAYRALVSSR